MPHPEAFAGPIPTFFTRFNLFLALAGLFWLVGFPLAIDVVAFALFALLAARAATPRLRLLLGAIVLSLALCEVATRFLLRGAGSAAYYRPHEKHERVRGYERDVDETFSMPHGDLAAIDPLVSHTIRQPRVVHFETDNRGYRNDSDYAGAPLALAGDSFLVGTGNDQKDILVNVLRREHGVDAYSIASATGPRDYLNAIKMFEANAAPSIHAMVFVFEGNDFRGPGRGLTRPSTYDQLKVRSWNAVGAVFGLGRLVFNGTRLLGRILFPPVNAAVEIYRVGRHDMGFYGSYIDKATANSLEIELGSALPGAVDHVEAVFFVPTKYRVYHSLLDAPGRRLRVPSPGHATLEQVFLPYGIPVIDLTPALIEGAHSLLEREEYVFWRDDTHWNAHGIRIAAREVAAFVHASTSR